MGRGIGNPMHRGKHAGTVLVKSQGTKGDLS